MDCKTASKDATKLNEGPFLRNTFSVLSLYWKSEEKIFAWCALIALVVLSLLAVVTALAINEWYKHFYNAIQDLDAYKFYSLVAVFLAIVSFSVVRSVLITYLVDVFALKWRRWLTNHYLSVWIVKSARPDQVEQRVDNPDQRIAEDINKFTYETIDLACGLIYTLASVISFSVVLIGISGDASLWGITVPAYMFWAAILYAFLGTYISQKIGFKLVSLSNNQQRSEADLRYFLIRFRDGAKMYSADTGRHFEKDCISEKLDVSLANMQRTIRVKMRLSLFTESYSQLSLIFSSLLAVPRFFSGSIMFGDVMQINSAFGNLCENLSWFINAYHRLADWKATTDRLISFDGALALLSEVDDYSPLSTHSNLIIIANTLRSRPCNLRSHCLYYSSELTHPTWRKYTHDK
ncbi:ABC transporter ATP-binding protein [Pseudomonas chlororaphis subsp. aurantiaca]|uniref:SbmA/BacA-like family transporter n=1 Tax=Pseudomonas chlororaphis TaxID=587753 RepID=UPI000865CA5B|nr:SbmA/BacA-like family transporter [Pseudomonas chlororaphis]BAV75593.1 ABC transporter ATP-binding protein [Pseudomonas chlororaphis subsp. aurantiaca]